MPLYFSNKTNFMLKCDNLTLIITTKKLKLLM